MRIFGLDFTSNPSKASNSSRRAKKLTLAKCVLDGEVLIVEELVELNGPTDGDFSGFETWLQSEGRWASESEWVGGIDFPFGMPVEAVERFDWLKQSAGATWEAYVSAIVDNAADIDAFRRILEAWKKPSKSGKQERVFLLRRTDTLSSLAGARPSSPMKVHHQCNPAVGRMFFHGANRLRTSGVCVAPLRWNDCPRVVVEAYPRLVADKFVLGEKYKEQGDSSVTRNTILTGLADSNPYGITVRFANPADRRACVDDELGDQIDSVLAAVQAGWSHVMEQSECGSEPRAQRYGIPVFSVPCMNNIVSLEGWIADPVSFQSSVSVHRYPA
ncbi:MAG: hypothetical protein Rhob2KO_53310 [Rhodopirellula baltica]